ncbi:unnamed protein product [Prorocentrum cordatum]|uniref:Secreted protein n=1 Tax=Prorocentrum cordatum TaxID=2364126 RepID=A0ABN9WLN7_9DINO|nr:unnamed protein product [Polarella glacialis]
MRQGCNFFLSAESLLQLLFHVRIAAARALVRRRPRDAWGHAGTPRGCLGCPLLVSRGPPRRAPASARARREAQRSLQRKQAEPGLLLVARGPAARTMGGTILARIV